MGLFGSNTVTTVGTSVARLVTDAQVPNSVLEGMTRNLVNQEDQMVENVMEAMTTSIGSRAHRMFKYGKERYVFGLPSGSVLTSFAGKEASHAVIQSEVHEPVSMVYYHFGPLNNLHIGWKKLTEEHDYDYVTNKILSLSTSEKPVYLKDMRLIVTDATLEEASNGSLDRWGTLPTAGPTPEKKYQTANTGNLVETPPFTVEPGAAADYILVDTCWEEVEPITAGSTITHKVLKYGSFTISLSGFTFTADWHQAKYLTQSGKMGYWLYQHGAGNVALDAIFDKAYDDKGHFFPWAYFRYGKKSGDIDPSSPEYKSSVGLCKKLNINYQDMVDSIHQNPDIKDIEQAMLVMAVPADTTNKIEQRYLFDFFSALFDTSKVDGHVNAATNPFESGIFASLGVLMNRSSLIIQDKRFKMSLSWKNMVKRKVPGTIGAVGTYASGANGIPSSVTVPSLGGGTVTWDTTSKRHWYQHQVGEGVFEEVSIFELKMTYFILGGYTAIGDEDDDILLIPVDMNIAREYMINDREILYARGMHFVFNSVVVTKLKWYQTGLFKAVLLIIAIVVTILSYGSAWQTMAAVLAADGAVYAVVIFVLEQLLQYIIVRVALKIFVKLVGAKIAFIVAIVAAVAGAGMAIDAGSLSGAPFASELLSVSNGLIKEVSNGMQDDYKDLLHEQTDLQKFIKQQTKLLDETKDLLNHHEYLAPLVIFGEKPSDYYHRTVHSGNIGVLGLDAIASYVDVALTLPKLSDTLKL